MARRIGVKFSPPIPSIQGIPVTAKTVANAYMKYYRNQFIATNKKLYLNLFGIRVSTCDTSKPDDIVGGIRLSSSYFLTDELEAIVTNSSTDPAPLWLAKPFDREAQLKDGTAWLMEGQHLYRYIRTPKSSWSGGGKYCAFCPTKPVPAYRWKPTAADISAWRSGRVALSDKFIDDLWASKRANFKNSKVKISDSTDVCIHRSWAEQLFADSAGCQVISTADLNKFVTLCSWAAAHDKKYGNLFTYTLFTSEQFVLANKI
jgi:hypothetical protein